MASPRRLKGHRIMEHRNYGANQKLRCQCGLSSYAPTYEDRIAWHHAHKETVLSALVTPEQGKEIMK